MTRRALPAMVPIVLAAVIGVAARAGAQTIDVADPRPAASVSAAAPAPASVLGGVFSAEAREISDKWRLFREAHGGEKVHKGEDFGRALFTGQGLHPTVGSIAPGNGLAVGATMNLRRAMQSRPLVFSGSGEARVSIKGTWITGVTVDVLGSSPTRVNDHIHATARVDHASIRELAYFGPGPNSAKDGESRFAMVVTNARFDLTVPIAGGLSVFGSVEGLRTTPKPFGGSGFSSIETRFTDADAPGLLTPTRYVAFGGGANWTYPEAERLRGYRTGVTASFRHFHEVSGQAFSFRRADLSWTERWTPDTDADLGTFSVMVRLTSTTASAGNRVPFYLQPTLGGGDLDGQTGLRSFHDFRFRAPAAFVVQAEYERTIVSALGLLAFCDAGRVADRVRDLNVSHLRRSYGLGLTVHAGGLAVFKLYYAFGGGEGTRLVFGGNTNDLGPAGSPRGVF